MNWHLEVMARTIYGEARSETIRGRLAVGKVIMNRASDTRRWPHDIASVCLQRLQFSCWNDGDPNRSRLIALDDFDAALSDCRRVSELAMSKFVTDETEGANHYLTSALAQKAPPNWFDQAKITATIGAHVFLKL